MSRSTNTAPCPPSLFLCPLTTALGAPLKPLYRYSCAARTCCTRGWSMASMVESPASSCVSSDAEEEAAAKAMVVAGCPRCLMYVMLSEAEGQPRCPRCKSPVLLHFVADADININTNRQGSKS